VGGTGWYRKRFSAAALPADSQVEIVFDGVYMNSDFWLNGAPLGNHPYGYTSFAYDLTPHLRRDGENVIAVRVRNEGKNKRWYSGSGIYRHVWLNTTGTRDAAACQRPAASTPALKEGPEYQNTPRGTPSTLGAVRGWEALHPPHAGLRAPIGSARLRATVARRLRLTAPYAAAGTFMFSTIAAANSLVFSFVAPSIWRCKS